MFHHVNTDDNFFPLIPSTAHYLSGNAHLECRWDQSLSTSKPPQRLKTIVLRASSWLNEEMWREPPLTKTTSHASPEWHIKSVWILKIDWLPRTEVGPFICTLINRPARQNVAVLACQPMFKCRPCARCWSYGAKLALLVGGLTNNRLMRDRLTGWLTGGLNDRFNQANVRLSDFSQIAATCTSCRRGRAACWVAPLIFLSVTSQYIFLIFCDYHRTWSSSSHLSKSIKGVNLQTHLQRLAGTLWTRFPSHWLLCSCSFQSRSENLDWP